MFKKLLIANRGEIACRIIATANRLGIPTVAVYSDADRDALHVQRADEAVRLGPAPAAESYLLVEKIIAAAEKTGADAIHPGYGFLSENPALPRACEEAGISFVGPPATAIEAMGSKSAAKQLMEEAGVPLVPGYHGTDQSIDVLRSAAEEIGYPVILKATAGGGGKGMRQVWSSPEFEQALAAAKREAKAGFGDDTMLVEKYLTRPRHVEVQVFCDSAGNGVYLAERDCSVQRRHQKVVEEAPAPGMTDKLRASMGEAAVQAAQHIGYVGAGTVEFLLDEDGSFYFMEMNTRLQVEHPVTEMITGQDLVEWQLRVAAGENLPLDQQQVRIDGHAIEVRVYAEDPDNDFLPASGNLEVLLPPEESEHVRVDTGVSQGDEISVYYDPMIAKLVVWDETRERAVERLAAALRDYRIAGTVTNIEFLYNLITTRPFRAADLDTGFIERHRELIFHDRQQDRERDLPIAALACLLTRRQAEENHSPADPFSPWSINNAWRLNETHVHRLNISCHGAEHAVAITETRQHYLVEMNGTCVRVRGRLAGDILHLEIDGHRQRGTLVRTRDGFTLYLSRGALQFSLVSPDTGEAVSAGAGSSLTAPMNGTIVTLLVETGEQVSAGTPLITMEAMKMEHTLKAPADGTVTAFLCKPGDRVDGGMELVDFEPAGREES